jgi:hypothetical protein
MPASSALFSWSGRDLSPEDRLIDSALVESFPALYQTRRLMLSIKKISQ